MHRPVENDAAVVIQQGTCGVDGKESRIEVGVDDLLEDCLICRAGWRPACDPGIDGDKIQLTEVVGEICKQPLAILRDRDIGSISASFRPEFADRLIERLLITTGNGDFSAFSDEEASGCKSDAAVATGNEGLFCLRASCFLLLTWPPN